MMPQIIFEKIICYTVYKPTNMHCKGLGLVSMTIYTRGLIYPKLLHWTSSELDNCGKSMGLLWQTETSQQRQEKLICQLIRLSVCSPETQEKQDW